MSKEKDQINQALARKERTVCGRLPHKAEVDVQKAILHLAPLKVDVVVTGDHNTVDE